MADCVMGEREGHPPTPAPPSEPVATSSKYQPLLELGRGGTAVVYAALARGLGGFSKLVVLKKTRQELAEHPDAVRMFLNEARLSARMNHPNVVQVYEVFEDQGLPVIVMEYLEGQSFATVLRRLHQQGGYSVELALGVLCQALEGLHYAHSLTDYDGRPLGIIHRDVTPHNIFVTYDGQVKLLDFGIAKLDAEAHQTRTGVIKGKLAYMPREQIEGGPLDCRSDLFALGVILWEVVAGRRMWGTLGEPVVMKHLLCNEIPRLRDARPDVDPALDQIVSTAIAPEPERRYRSAEELLRALTGYLEQRGGVASQSAIAELVHRTCADLKAKSRSLLDRELARVSQSASDPVSSLPAGTDARVTAEPALAATRRWERGVRDTLTRTGFAGQLQSSLPPVQRRRWPSVLALAGGALVALALGWVSLHPPGRGGGEGAAAVLSPASAGAPSGSPAAPAPSIRLVLQATPEQAALYLDGVRLAANPFAGVVPSDGRPHELRVTAEGFLPLTRQIQLDADTEIRLALEPVPAADPPEAVQAESLPLAAPLEAPPRPAARSTRPQRPAPRRSPPRAHAPGVQARPAAAHPATEDCSPPYSIDELGVKRYKRECLGQ